MASNGRGGMRPQHGSRTPPFVLIGLLVVCAILAFNYWNAASKNSMLVKEIGDLQDNYRGLSMKKIAVEKRNDALLEKIKEGETEIARFKALISGKEGEIDNLKNSETDLQSQLNDVKESLNSCDSKQETCLGSLNSFELKLNDSEANLLRAQEECSNRIASQNEENKKTTSDQAGQVRLELLTKIQELLGHAAMMVLQEASVDLNGVALDPTAVGRHSLCANLPQSNVVQNQPLNNNLPLQGGGFVNNGLAGGGENQNMLPGGVVQQQPFSNNTPQPPVVGDVNNPNLNQVINPGLPNIQPPVNNDLSPQDQGSNLGAVNPPSEVNQGNLPESNPINQGAQPGSDALIGSPGEVLAPRDDDKVKDGIAFDSQKPAEGEERNEEIASENVPIGVPIGQEPDIAEKNDEEVEENLEKLENQPTTSPNPKDDEVINDNQEQPNIQAPPGIIGNEDEAEEEDENADDVENEEGGDQLAPVGIQDVEGEEKQEDFDDEIDPNDKNEALKFDADKEQDVNGAGDIDAEDDAIDNMHQKMNDDAEDLETGRDVDDQIDM